MTTDLNAVKSRLGSISDSRMALLPHAVQRLLLEDAPRLIEEVASLRKRLDGYEKRPLTHNVDIIKFERRVSQ